MGITHGNAAVGIGHRDVIRIRSNGSGVVIRRAIRYCIGSKF